MIFDIFISRKSSKLLDKLDEDLKEMLMVFYTLDDRYSRKLKFIKRCRDEQESGKVASEFCRHVLDDVLILRIVH